MGYVIMLGNTLSKSHQFPDGCGVVAAITALIAAADVLVVVDARGR